MRRSSYTCLLANEAVITHVTKGVTERVAIVPQPLITLPSSPPLNLTVKSITVYCA